MSYPNYNNDIDEVVEEQVEDVVEDIKAENSFIDDIFDNLAQIFYTIFPGLKTELIEDELTIMELREDEGYVPLVALTDAQKKALENTENAEDSEDLFNTLSNDLGEEEYEKELERKRKETEAYRKKLAAAAASRARAEARKSWSTILENR